MNKMDTVSINVDQCLGVANNGKLVYGKDASKSCFSIHVMRQGDGVIEGVCYRENRIDIVKSIIPLGDVFVGARIGGPRIRCAH
jgi:hypothetical protein